MSNDSSISSASNFSMDRTNMLREESLPPFNIEKDSDPRMDWMMYYDFKVDKTKAYYELKPDYLEFPHRRSVDPETSNGLGHSCRVLGCVTKPFARHYDLERHFDRRHRESVDIRCDYRKCPHRDSFRKDHGREHYREYHMEDLIKRNDPRVQEFLEKRRTCIQPAWWRCSRCLRRVMTLTDGYECSGCKRACEPERVAMRQRIEEEELRQEEEERQREEEEGEGEGREYGEGLFYY